MGMVIALLLLWAGIALAQGPHSVRQAAIEHDGRLAVSITEAGPGTMKYTVQAEASAVYQCLGANYTCPSVLNRQEVSAMATADATLKVVTTAGQLVAGLIHGQVFVSVPLSALICAEDENNVPTLMSVRYQKITVYNTTLNTSGPTKPASLGAIFHTCPLVED